LLIITFFYPQWTENFQTKVLV